MTNYERLTASPDTLGAFLATLPVTDVPGTRPFKRSSAPDAHKRTVSQAAPHQDKRNNPAWWLMQETERRATL